VKLRRQLPLFSLGILWYFAAHLLTATIIPLELVFEHRNYFASIGLLLALAALLLEIPSQFTLLRFALPILVLGWFAAVLWLQTHEWGNPVRFGYAEALEHPESPRANYELGRTLVVISDYRPDSKLISPAMQAFEKAAKLPNSGVAPLAAMILVAAHTRQQVLPQWWSLLKQKLVAQPPSEEDIGALQSLVTCQHQGVCSLPPQEMLSAFLAAMDHPNSRARLMAAYGAFAANQLRDYALAETLFKDAIAASPQVEGYRIDLARIFYLQGQFSQASLTVNQIQNRDLDQTQREDVTQLKKQIRKAVTTPDKD